MSKHSPQAPPTFPWGSPTPLFYAEMTAVQHTALLANAGTCPVLW